MTSQAWVYVLFGGAIFAAAYQTQAGWLFVIGGACVAMLLVAWALARYNVRGLRLRAYAPAPTYQGEVVELPVALERPGARTAHDIQVMAAPRPPGRLFKLWRDAIVPPGWPYVTLDVPAGGRADAVLRLPAPSRGEFDLPPLVVQSAWPMGLVIATRMAPAPIRYLVYPVGPRLGEVPWLAAALARQGVSSRVEAGHGQLLRGVREYRSGDAWRQVHWRTTARLGKPHVKESEREAGERLVLWLDLRAEVHTEATLEHMIAVATAIVDHARGRGRSVELACQPEAAPEVAGRPGDPALVWLALARATAPAGAPLGPEGAVALSPAALPGWRAWASAFVWCPPGPGPAGTAGRDAGAAPHAGGGPHAGGATATCPVGADVAAALAAGSLAA